MCTASFNSRRKAACPYLVDGETEVKREREGMRLNQQVAREFSLPGSKVDALNSITCSPLTEIELTPKEDHIDRNIVLALSLFLGKST